MQLLTKTIRRSLPPLYTTEHDADPIVRIKFFDPTSEWTWYATEAGAEDGDTIFFGMVDGFEREMGYFSLSELQAVRGRFGLGIERDLHFTPCKLSEVR